MTGVPLCYAIRDTNRGQEKNSQQQQQKWKPRFDCHFEFNYFHWLSIDEIKEWDRVGIYRVIEQKSYD